jgi:hypothetical protein
VPAEDEERRRKKTASASEPSRRFRWLFQQAIPAEDEERMLSEPSLHFDGFQQALPAEDEERRRKKIAIAAVIAFLAAFPTSYSRRRAPMKEEELMLQPAQSLSLMAC